MHRIFRKSIRTQEILLAAFPQGSILGPLLFLLYINYMPQAVKCDLLPTFQYENVKEIKNWFLIFLASVIGLSTTNYIFIWVKIKLLFGIKPNTEWAEPLNTVYGTVKIKQYIKVTYLHCILDESLSGESMALHILNKINSRLRFLYRQNKFLNKLLQRTTM